MLEVFWAVVVASSEGNGCIDGQRLGGQVGSQRQSCVGAR